MTEKEFLQQFTIYCQDRGYGSPYYISEEVIQGFLDIHHKTYEEVEFITIDEMTDFYRQLEAK